MNRRRRLDAFLDRRDLDVVWFARSNSFSWLTGGSNVVDRASPVGVAAVGYDGEWRVVTDSIEADRIEREELPELAATVIDYPWYEMTLPEAIAEHTDGQGGADLDVPGMQRIDASPLRQPLTDPEMDRYRELGRETAEAVESVCRGVQPDDTESTVATAIEIALTSRGIDAPVVLVGGGERAPQYRHYTQTDAVVGEYALVSVTARRRGLHASCTRTIAFDPPTWLHERHRAAARIETTALATTWTLAPDDGTAGDAFARIQDAYDTLGYQGEWRHHHQGGAAGYAGREWIATPDHEASLTMPMAYAWNPTVEGAKSEDTVLVTGDGLEIVTSTGEWPTRSTAAVDTDVELERPEPLVLD